jgi:hypothetical protein
LFSNGDPLDFMAALLIALAVVGLRRALLSSCFARFDHQLETRTKPAVRGLTQINARFNLRSKIQGVAST